MIQDFNPASPGSCTAEAITLDDSLIHPNGHWTETLGIAAWSDSADFIVTFGNNGAICMRYEDKATGT